MVEWILVTNATFSVALFSVIAQSRTSLVVWKVKEFKMISTEF
jgi:hypothetical protein